jgi:hypothetical protein
MSSIDPNFDIQKPHSYQDLARFSGFNETDSKTSLQLEKKWTPIVETATPIQSSIRVAKNHIEKCANEKLAEIQKGSPSESALDQIEFHENALNILRILMQNLRIHNEVITQYNKHFHLKEDVAVCKTHDKLLEQIEDMEKKVQVDLDRYYNNFTNAIFDPPPDNRDHPPSDLCDAFIDGRSKFPDITVYQKNEISSEAEYIYSEPIDDDPSIVAKLTRDGKWVMQQQGKTACTAAVTAMLIKDHYKPIHIENLQSEIRSDEDVILDLKKAGLKVIPKKYEHEPANKMDVLQKEIERSGPAIVTIRYEGAGNHAIIVDKISAKGVLIRDPYHGRAITVKHDAFAASLILTDIIQVESNLALESSLHPDDFEIVVRDEAESFLSKMVNFENQEYTYADLIQIATSISKQSDNALIALKRHASIETFKSYESALLNARNFYEKFKKQSFDSTLENCHEKLIQHEAVFDELSKRFTNTPQRTQSESPPRNLEDYLKKSSEGISPVDAKQMTATGETLVDKIIHSVRRWL